MCLGKVTGWATRTGRGCGLQNPHPQPTLTRGAGYPNPLRVVYLAIGVGAGFLYLTSPTSISPSESLPPMETCRRCKSPRFFCSSMPVNCGSEQILHNQQFSQVAINKVCRVVSCFPNLDALHRSSPSHWHAARSLLIISISSVYFTGSSSISRGWSQ
jgi:hypothetical protein